MRTILQRSRLFSRHFPACGLCRNAGSHASFQEVSRLQEKKMKSILYPVTDLEKVVSPDVDRNNFRLFDPPIEEIAATESVFRPSGKHVIDYVTSAVRMDHTPDLQQPEVCFIGRSNVGKSSLIKALFALVPGIDVRISKTPFEKDISIGGQFHRNSASGSNRSGNVRGVRNSLRFCDDKDRPVSGRCAADAVPAATGIHKDQDNGVLPSALPGQLSEFLRNTPPPMFHSSCNRNPAENQMTTTLPNHVKSLCCSPQSPLLKTWSVCLFYESKWAQKCGLHQ
ncbi:GTP-binding protein 8 isoform X2 [Rana temporaria]|uniref:GTP-binding protein 8 isoform X2 n=1 Tax=Rana temporaria TaxID=8407 RepID=UPI001AACCC7B|nr:GTP-binding protein 8 isoform X2 [Rana temporaria]